MMTYKKFVESAVEEAAAKWIGSLVGDDWCVFADNVKLERGSSILYEVEILLYKPGQYFGKKKYTVGGAIGEYTGICNSVIWGKNDEYGVREVVWGHSKELRFACGITAERFIP